MGNLMSIKFDKKQKLIFLLCIIFVSITYISQLIIWAYPDTANINSWSVCFWDALFSGNIKNFYEYCSQQGILVDSVWITFFLWILWFFPIWLINHFVIPVSYTVCIMYSKTMLFICLSVLCIFVYKIIKSFKKVDDAKALFFTFIIYGSLEIFESIGYAGQDEIVYLMFYTIGLYFLVNEKRLIALLFFTFSITACTILIIPIFCQYIVFQKDLKKIFAYMGAMLLPTMAFEFFYRNDSLYHSLKYSNTTGIFQSMMNTGTIESSVGNTPVAFVVIVIVAVMCYVFNGNIENKKTKCIHYGAIAFFALAMLTYVSCYRFCIYLPIFVILLGIQEKNINLKAFLLMIVGMLRFIYMFVFGNIQCRFFSAIMVKLFGDKVLSYGYADTCVVDRLSGTMDKVFYICRPIIIGLSIYYLYMCITDKDDSEFKIDYSYIVVINSFSGVLFTIYSLYLLLSA